MTRRRVSAILWAGALFTSSAAEAAITWRADFETGDLSQFQGNVNATNGARKNIEFVSDPVEQGKLSGKFTIHQDDLFSTTQMRVQITRSGSTTGEGQDVFMSWYFRLPADPLVRDNIAYWESNASYHNMMTWWVTPKMGGGTTFDFGTGNLGSTKHIYSGDISINQWHQVASHIHWSTIFQQGHIIVWLDGQKIVDENAQTRADENPLFFQAGIQRATRSTASDAIYFDNFIEGSTLADIMVNAPPDGGAVDGAVSSDASSDGGDGTGGAAGAGGGAGSGGATNGAGGDGSGGAASTSSGSSGAGGASAGGASAGSTGGLSSGGGAGDSKPGGGTPEGGCSCMSSRPNPRSSGVLFAATLALLCSIRRRRQLTH